MIKAMFILFVLSFSYALRAQSTVVAVGEAQVEKEAIYVKAKNKEAAAVAQIIENDFKFYKKNFVISAQSNMSRYLVEVNKSKEGERTRYTGTLEVKGKEKVIINYDQSGVPNERRAAHFLANDIYKHIVGVESIFLTKIYFVSDRDGNRSNRIKELYSMDFDGKNAKRLTHHRGTVISPAVSFDGKKVLYSLIKNTRSKTRNVNLYMLDVETGKSDLLSSKKGINSGAIFMPGGKTIMMTMSHQGNAELYEMDLATKKTKRITKHVAPDVDPSVNKDGSLMAFLSGRSGANRPMIYIGDPRAQEKNVKRISYVGKFNATPRFSPNGKEIAFSSWLDNRFDIFRIDSDGKNLSRLTKDFGSNEDPSYSNDGQFIAFSSQRVLSVSKAVQNIYIMDREGDILDPITEDLGNCSSPRWSK